ncbi:hypothetical protein F7Q99_21200 [Streptomyces kaniharaensis]|uniref:Uncharacterized protein n=1 Tax=Streptomyces kaniharaensis TaxID=212423 RepID=A0A6N7KTE2_9ACTN|nr:hypothetical protein [Streptomyces kaniharaensis]MQS14711.1 hypothetical protein [Streptomyces kaniharaensis]
MRRLVLGAICFLIGTQVGAAALYLLLHRAEIHQPVYLGIFAVATFGTLAAVDRLVNHRAAPSDRHSSRVNQPPAG